MAPSLTERNAPNLLIADTAVAFNRRYRRSSRPP